MSHNRKALRVDLGKYYKPNPYKKDIITDPEGQWKYPGQVTRIPGNQITMQGVPYPVFGQDDTGFAQMMYPGQEYMFPGNYVDEIPMAQEGMTKLKDDSDWYKLTDAQKQLLQRDNNLDVVKKWYENSPEDMEGRFKEYLDQYNAQKYLDQLDPNSEEYKRFNQALTNNREWYKNWYTQRKKLPQFADVAAQRLAIPNAKMQSVLADPINLSVNWWKKKDPEMPPVAFYAPEIGGITRENVARYNIDQGQYLDGDSYEPGQLLQRSYYEDPQGKLQSSLLSHEELHMRDFLAPQSNTKKSIKKSDWGKVLPLDPIEKIISQEEAASDIRNRGYSSYYQQQPTEVRARLNVWRMKNGIDPLKNYTEEELKMIMDKDLKNPNLDPNIKELYETIKNNPNKLKFIHDSYVQNNSNKDVNGLQKAKVGGIPELPLTAGRKAYHAWGYTNNDFIAKRQEGGYIETELTPEEIDEYRKGGFVVEELPKAQTGRNVKPLYVTDPNDVRLAAYNDSLWLYNQNKKPLPKIKNRKYEGIMNTDNIKPYAVNKKSNTAPAFSKPNLQVASVWDPINNKYTPAGLYWESSSINKNQAESPYFKKGVPTNKPIKYESVQGRWMKHYLDNPLGDGVQFRLPGEDKNDDITKEYEYARFKKPVQPVILKKSSPPDKNKSKVNTTKNNTVKSKTTDAPNKPIDNKAVEDKVKPLTTKPTVDKNAIVQNTKKQLPNKPVEKVDQSRLKPAAYRAQWKQNPITGTWYQDEAIDLKGDSTVYNPATGGYTKRKYAEGGYMELDLTPEEIQQYKDGGYIVEDISVPTLTKAQEGLEQEVYRNQEVPEVPVVAEAPDWLKFSREYENIKSKDAFVEEKKRKYLKQNKGLNKLAGLSMDNFPKEVESNFANEYDYKKNTYVTRKLGKKEGFNPRHRGDWVDELTPGEQKVVANSKYGSKLQPGAYARTLAGAQELVNALIKREPGRRGDVLRYKIPGLTSREQKEIAESPTGALEIFSAFDAPTGYNVANFLKNRGLSTGSNYKELPGITSGELMPNVSEGEALAFNPFTYYGLVHPSAAILKGGYKGVGKVAKKLFKDVVEEIPEAATQSIDLTRPARPPKPKKYYDEFEDEGFTVIKKNGTSEKPKDIIIKKGDNYIHAELNKDGTWKFHNKWHDPDNPRKGILEAGKAMKMMNKHIPAFPKIRETQSFSPDSYKNIVNLTKHPDWEYKIAGRIPLNNQARVSNLTKDAMENSHASTVVKGKENAQRIVDEINSMLEKKGFNNPLHHKAFYRGLIEDEYEVLLPNFELSRNYRQGGALELELTPEEIQAYRDQGYTVEELD